MLFYFTILLLIGTFSILEVLGFKNKHKLFVYIILSTSLFALSFIRWKTGTDWMAYYYFFMHSPPWGDFGGFEPLFASLNTLVKHFSDNYTILLFTLALILFYYQSKGIIWFSKYPITSLFILMGISFGNILFARQTISVAILFYSVKFIEGKKLLRFCTFVLFASLIHQTSIIFLFAWSVYYLKISRKAMFLYVLVSIGLSFIVILLFKFIDSILVSGIIKYKISQYFSESGSESSGSSYSVWTIILKGFANKLLILFIGFYLLSNVRNRLQELQGYVNLFWFGTIIYFSTVSVSVVLVRFSYAFDIFQIIIIPFLFDVCKNNITRILILGVLLIYLAIRMNIGINNYYEFFVPYKTFLNSDNAF
jgi:hypothetical protein